MNIIPDVIIDIISSYLTLNHLSNYRSTCKYINKKSSSSYLKALDKIPWRISIDYRKNDYFQSLKILEISVKVGYFNRIEEISEINNDKRRLEKKSNIIKYKFNSVVFSGIGGIKLRKLLEQYETCKILLSNKFKLLDIVPYNFKQKEINRNNFKPNGVLLETCDIEIGKFIKLDRIIDMDILRKRKNPDYQYINFEDYKRSKYRL